MFLYTSISVCSNLSTSKSSNFFCQDFILETAFLWFLFTSACSISCFFSLSSQPPSVSPVHPLKVKNISWTTSMCPRSPQLEQLVSGFSPFLAPSWVFTVLCGGFAVAWAPAPFGRVPLTAQCSIQYILCSHCPYGANPSYMPHLCTQVARPLTFFLVTIHSGRILLVTGPL